MARPVSKPNSDDKAYAETIDTLLGDNELMEKYRENARKREIENFTIPKMVEKQEECYREIEC